MMDGTFRPVLVYTDRQRKGFTRGMRNYPQEKRLAVTICHCPLAVPEGKCSPFFRFVLFTFNSAFPGDQRCPAVVSVPTPFVPSAWMPCKKPTAAIPVPPWVWRILPKYCGVIT